MNKRTKVIGGVLAVLLVLGCAAWVLSGHSPQVATDRSKIDLDRLIEFAQRFNDCYLDHQTFKREYGPQVEPYTTIKPLGSDNPEDLWKWMLAYQEKTGGSVLAIPHNGNLSNGQMFPMVEAFGKKLDRDYVVNRAKWERLYEATQTKGDGEAHPFLSPNDEFADYETWDKGNLDGTVAKTKDMLQFEYARSALKIGLKLERDLGANPYKFGLIGSSVDLENATWTNTIGSPELLTVWKDPEFDAKRHAFYYVRVIEIPTPRWTAYDATRFGVKPLEGTRMTITERAYTSPIWYSPEK